MFDNVTLFRRLLQSDKSYFKNSLTNILPNIFESAQ